MKKALLLVVLFGGLALVALGCDDSGSPGGGSTAVCGNGKVEGDEECDGTDLNLMECTDFGYDSGRLRCSDTCKYDFSLCEYSTCGNGQLDEGEECDGTAMRDGTTCDVLGYLSHAPLGCTETCHYDVSQCGSNCDDGDGLVCTAGVMDASGMCVDTRVLPDWCLIDGECYQAGEREPSNPCLVCAPTESQGEWKEDNGATCPLDGTDVVGICYEGHCVSDRDQDGIPDEGDNCPDASNIAQLDTDSDGVGDVCDNCVATQNPDQSDMDGDGIGDACDNCPHDATMNLQDSDGDGVGDVCDNCPGLQNPDQSDMDGDGIGDACDNCLRIANPDQSPGSVMGVGAECLVLQMALGNGFTCVLTESRHVLCAGTNSMGQIAQDAAVTSSATPVMVYTEGGTPLENVIEIAAGYDHACALVSTGTGGPELWCWGGNAKGQIHPDIPDIQVRRAVKVMASQGLCPALSHVRAGGQFTCVTEQQPNNQGRCSSSTVRVKCWGESGAGQTGQDSTDTRVAPDYVITQRGPTFPVEADTEDLVLGDGHACIRMSSGTSMCWGRNTSGQLGMGDNYDNQLTAVAALDGSPTVHVGEADTGLPYGLGGSHSCFITSDDHVVCTGAGGQGQLGNGATPNPQKVNVPVEAGQWYTLLTGDRIFVPLTGVSMIAAGQSHTCVYGGLSIPNQWGGSTYQQGLMCWGDNSYGQLGTGSTASANTPQFVAGTIPGTIMELETGAYHNCVLSFDSASSIQSVWCWGYGTGGGLLDGSAIVHHATTPVRSPFFGE